MSTPLDHHQADRTGRVQAARLFSNIVSPPVMFAILGLAFALVEMPDWRGLAWAAVYGFFVSLLPILLVLYLLRTGRIAELHMSNTGERHLPYISAVLAAAIAFGLIALLDGPELLRCLALFNVLELIVLALINVYWLVSIHATGITATALLAGLVFGWWTAWLLLPLVILVCWVRLYLKRHTPGQLLAGIAMGATAVFAMTLIGCF